MDNDVSLYIPQPASVLDEDIPENLEPKQQAFYAFQQLVNMKRVHDASFLALGKWLTIVSERRLYVELDYSSFREFCASPDLVFSEEYAYRLMRIYRIYVRKLGLSDEDIKDVPVTRLVAILPRVKDTDSAQEVRELLQDVSSMGSADFQKTVQQWRPTTRPMVWWSEEHSKWIVQYYDEHTILKGVRFES